MLLLLLMGVGALGGSAYWSLANLQFRRVALKAEGTIVKLERRTNTTHRGKRPRRIAESRTTWAPVFEFTDTVGATQRVASSYSSSSPSRKLGDKVPVLYAQNDAQSARIDTFASFWPGPLICLMLGAVFTAFGITVGRKASRK